MSLTIRDYHPETDLIPLREIYLLGRQGFHWTETARFQLADFDQSTEGEWILVAEIGGRVVGFSAVWKPENFIHSLFLHPDFQGQGIGSALLTECLARMERPATLKCSAANEGALRFYEQRGWFKESEGKADDGPYFLMKLA